MPKAAVPVSNGMINDRLSAILVITTFTVSLLGSSMGIVAWERSAGVRRAEAAALLLPLTASRETPRIEPAGISAEAYLVRTFSGETLGERGLNAVHPMASLTKVMTGLLLREWGEGADIWVTPRAKEVAPKHSLVTVGEILPAETALTLLLAESDNDIAEAIADSIGVDIDGRAADPRGAFLRAMNKKAAVIGMRSTHFDNPSGLDSGLQHSNVEDLFRLAQYVTLKYEDFWDVTVDPPARVKARSGKSYPVRPSNLLKNEGIVGVKTGLSENAKGALLIRYRTPYFPEDIIIVILRSDDRFGDGERLMAAVSRALRKAAE